MPLLISRNDITAMQVDAIVNAANTDLLMGGGVCGAIFCAAGPEKLQAACNKLSPIKTGEAVITDGFDSKAKFIIHTAGPIYRGGNHGEEQQLFNCYANSLKLAAENNVRSIAFPLISSGIYGYPPNLALKVALKSIHNFLGNYDGEITVYMIVYNDSAFEAAEQLFVDVKSYIDKNLIKDDTNRRRLRNENIRFPEVDCAITAEAAMPIGILPDDILSNIEDNFCTNLFKFIKQKKMSNAEVYKNANIDRRLFSKIISNSNYTPRKNTIFALAVSLKLNLQETQTLLRSAGYAISHSVKSDLIIEYYITHKNPQSYNIDDLNFLLFKYREEQLGQE